MKAIILTYAPITSEEENLLKETSVYKIACNTYRAEVKPDVRLTSDNIVNKCLECDLCPVISINYDLEKERVINGCHYPDMNSSLLNCACYLVLNGYTSILLVANNLKTNRKDISLEFQELNRKGINKLKEFACFYKYSDIGVFDIPTKTIKDFIMDDESLILGVTVENKTVRILKTLAFSEDFKYEIKTIGKNNASIEGGNLIANILPLNKKEEILNGEEVITYNDLEIRRLTKIPSFESSVNNEPKIDVDNMSYNEMQKFVSKHSLQVESYTKESLKKAIKDYING